jgi:hypothetical protein
MFIAHHQDCGTSIPKETGCDHVGHGEIVSLQGQGAELYRHEHGSLIGVAF